MTVWNAESKSLIQTRTMKVQWEGTGLPTSVDMGILGSFETIHSPTRQMLHMSNSTIHRAPPTQERTYVPMWRPSSNQGMCRQTQCKRNRNTKMSQLQGSSLHGQYPLPISIKDACSASPASPTSQVGIDNGSTS